MGDAWTDSIRSTSGLARAEPFVMAVSPPAALQPGRIPTAPVGRYVSALEVARIDVLIMGGLLLIRVWLPVPAVPGVHTEPGCEQGEEDQG